MGASTTAGGAERPIFIVGFSRSGTSLLRAMLNAHPNIHISQESAFYQWLAPDRLRGCDTAAAWLRGYSRTASFRLLRVSPAPALQALPPDLPRAQAGPRAMPLLLGEKARRLGRARWGDKTPLHSLRLDAIFRDFPEARVIHVTRHPAGVADSLARMPWGCDSGVFNGLLYRRVSEQVRRWGDRVLCLRLEDLVANPQAQLERALAHVGEPWSALVLDHAAHTAAADDPPLPWLTPAAAPVSTRARAPGLSPAELRLVERAAGPALLAEGYAPTPLDSAPGLGAMAAALWRDLSRGARFLRRLVGEAPPLHPPEAIDAVAQVRFLFQLNPSRAVPPGWREIPPELMDLLMKPV